MNNPVSFSGDVSPSEKSEMLEILSILGKTFEVSEQKKEIESIFDQKLKGLYSKLTS